jgi:hypothetical protein
MGFPPWLARRADESGNSENKAGSLGVAIDGGIFGSLVTPFDDEELRIDSIDGSVDGNYISYIFSTFLRSATCRAAASTAHRFSTTRSGDLPQL